MALVKVDNVAFDSLHAKSTKNKNFSIMHTGTNGQEVVVLGTKIDDDKILKFIDATTGAEEEYISRKGGVWEIF